MAAVEQIQADHAPGGNHELHEAILANLRSVLLAEQWPFEACKIADADVLIADPAFVEMLNSAKGTRQTRILTPDVFEPDAIDGDVRVFVMLQRGELAYVRSLMKHYPDRIIISVTYGEHGTSVDLASVAAQGLKLTTVISSPCSGSGYLLRLIGANRLANEVVSLRDAEISWAKCQQDFDLVRFLLGKLRGKQGHVILDLSLGLIDHLRALGVLPNKVLRFFIIAAEARTVFMIRRNRADQIALMATGGKTSTQEPDLDALLPVVLELIACEARYEKFFGMLPKFRAVTFEELTESPIEVVKMLNSFFGRHSLKNISVIEPGADELDAVWKDSFRAHFRENVVNFLGLSKNQHGSYQTKTEQLLADQT